MSKWNEAVSAAVEELGSVVGANSPGGIMQKLTVTRQKKDGSGTKELKATLKPFQRYINLRAAQFVEKKDGSTPTSHEIGLALVAAENAKRKASGGKDFTTEQEKAYFSGVVKINEILKALDFSEQTVEVPFHDNINTDDLAIKFDLDSISFDLG